MKKYNLIPFIVFLFLSFLIVVNLRGVVGFNSPDEVFFLSYLKSGSSGMEGNKIYYIVWSYIQSSLYAIYPQLNFIINSLLSCLSFRLLIKWDEKVNPILFSLIFILPSVMIYHQTYLRDIIMLSLMMVLMATLSRIDKIGLNFNKIFFVFILVSILFFLRSIVGAIVIISLFFVILRVSIKGFILYFFPMWFLVSGVLLLFPELSSFYEHKVIYFEEATSNFGLFGLDSSSIDYFGKWLTAAFSFFPFWFTFGFLTGSMTKLPLVLESIFLAYILFVSFLKIMTMKSRELQPSLRFSIFCIILTAFIAAFETGQATSLRHKLAFLPCLFFVFSRVFDKKNV